MCRRLAENSGYSIVNLDALTYAASPNSLVSISQQSNYKFVKGDICDGALVGDLFNRYKFDTVIHLAAESHVDRSISGPLAFVNTNVLGTCVLLEAARSSLDNKGGDAHDAFRFLHVSTDEVYGDLKESDPAFSETHPYKPSSPYSASKAASDHMVRAWGRTYGIPYIITNCSNNYGPYQFPEKLIPLVIISAICGRQLPVYGSGANIRDWLHVEDHALALESVMLKGNIGETYNIGSKAERRNIDVVTQICTILDNVCPREDRKSYSEQICFVTDRPGHDQRYAIDNRKITKEIGWRATSVFEKRLEETVCWYLENKYWWEPLIESQKK